MNPVMVNVVVYRLMNIFFCY